MGVTVQRARVVTGMLPAASLHDEIPEADGVHRVARRLQDVAGLASGDLACVVEHGAQARHIGLQRLARRPRLVVTPQEPVQPIDADRFAGIAGQQRQDAAFATARQLDEPAVAQDFERSEQADLERVAGCRMAHRPDLYRTATGPQVRDRSVRRITNRKEVERCSTPSSPTC
jgi:hypothetical protein